MILMKWILVKVILPDSPLLDYSGDLTSNLVVHVLKRCKPCCCVLKSFDSHRFFQDRQRVTDLLLKTRSRLLNERQVSNIIQDVKSSKPFFLLNQLLSVINRFRNL